jgi:hypothetical protein
MHNTESRNLLSWQWAGYRDAHSDRRNLIVHVLTTPLFIAGSVAIALAPWLHGWPAFAGFASMTVAMVLQGRGHRLEASAPAPFRGPLDVVVRIFAEQWITFPRYVVTGAFFRAFRAADGPVDVGAPTPVLATFSVHARNEGRYAARL